MASLMELVRQVLGLEPPAPHPMSEEQSALAAEQADIQDRLTARQRAIELSRRSVDLQIEVLRADRARERRRASH